MIKTLLSQVKEYKKDSILTPIYMFLEVITEIMIPLLMGYIVDRGIGKEGEGDLGYIFKVGALMLVISGISMFAGIMGGKYGARASTGFARNLRSAMFKNIQGFSFSNIDKFSTAGLVTRLTTDVTNLQMAYQMILRLCVRSPSSLICAMVMAFSISPRIASIYLIGTLFLGTALFLIMRRTTKYFNQVFKKYDALNESVQENVSAIRVVKAYVREDYETDKFCTASKNIAKMFVNAEKILVLNSPLMQLTVYGCILLISWIGAQMVVSATLTTGQLATLLAYCMSILMSLMMLSMVFVMITMSAASARRVAEVLNEKPTITNPEKPVFEVESGDIDFENVTFSYKADGEKDVLKDINLSIKSGETIGIIGGTGSSKTSLVSLVSRLYDVKDGKVKVGGKDVRDYDIETLRNQVSVVLQKNLLFSGTILDNLRWGDENASEEDCIRACTLACADDFIRSFPEGYNTYIEQGGTNVSGGQKQRLCIARALLKKPKILILDDSTSAVDTATDARIRKAFREEIPNTTKLIISQRISSVQDADRIIVLEDGVVSGFDTHDNLLKTNEIYRDVFESQTGSNGDFDEGGDN